MFEQLVAPLPGNAGACVDELDELERLKSALCARQARLAARLDELTPTASDRGTSAQVALARRESPLRGRRLLCLSRALEEMPHLRAALESGDLNERRAEIVAHEGRDLAGNDRAASDDALAADPHTLAGLGDHELLLAAQRQVMRIDEHGAARRRERAHARRRVTWRRLGDGQAQLSAVVADHEVAAIMTSLHERAGVLLALGDKVGEDRSRAQILADLVVARLTGQVTAGCTPVRIDLVASAETLLGDGDEPGEIPGVGPVPASVARKLALASPEQATRVRRLFADTNHLVAMESSSRTFGGLLRQFVELRDQVCRTPWCGARVLQIDHVVPAAAGGPTSVVNAQGLCVSCNLTKEEPGWRHDVVSGPVDRHSTTVTTPTGHQHPSHAPPAPRVPPALDPDDPRSWWEQRQPGVWTRIAA